MAAADRNEPLLRRRDQAVGQRVTAKITTVDAHLQEPPPVHPGRAVGRGGRPATGCRGGRRPAASSRNGRPPGPNLHAGIALQTPLPSQGRPGAHVDVLVAEPGRSPADGGAGSRELVTAAEMARVDTDRRRRWAAAGGVAVHVLVHPSQVAPLVDALGNDAKVTLVPNTTGSGS
ncbi:hypothetical protein QJS66_22725 [Kocuria rhizophila]|nr:hypothetical protein QJS66_22725 [Kocuria rhizophila]